MDLAHWGFRHWPFERSFQSARFFAGSLHEEGLARVMFLVEECRRFGIIMGPSGAGKTFLLKIMQQRAERIGRLTVRCDATGLEGNELARQIALACYAIGEADASIAKVWNSLNLRFMAMAMVQQPLVVIVDHFDFVHSNCLHTISRLNQLADTTGAKLTLVVATREPAIPISLNDIVELKIEIGCWTSDECSRFIKSAVSLAGCSKTLFTEDAATLIYELTHGIPANVVTLSSLALLAARESEAEIVGQEIIEALSAEVSSRTVGDYTEKRFRQARQALTS
jgi:type II secretory pathway predicted ATPase ExeA